MREIVVQQFMLPEYTCAFEDPAIQAAIPQTICKAVRDLFADDSVNIVTVTWNQGTSASFFVRPVGEALMTAEQFFAAPPLSSGRQSTVLRKTAYDIDEGITHMGGLA